MAYNTEHATKIKHLKLLAQRAQAGLDAHNTRLTALEGKAHEHTNKDVLDGITAAQIAQWGNGEANVLEGVKVNGVALAIAEKMVDILIATGTANGTIKVNGTDVSVAGLAALAYKAEVAESDLAAALKAVIDAKAESSDLSTLEGKVDVLIGSVQGDGAKSVRTISAEEVAKIVAGADASYDTLKEIADWIMSDTTGAAKMQSDITALKTKLTLGTDGNDDGYPTVKAYVEAVVAGLGMGNYYTKTETDDLLDDKVDKVTGKGLSTEDYTTAEKTKLAGLEWATDAEVTEMLDEVFGSGE